MPSVLRCIFLVLRSSFRVLLSSFSVLIDGASLRGLLDRQRTATTCNPLASMFAQAGNARTPASFAQPKPAQSRERSFRPWRGARDAEPRRAFSGFDP